MTTREWQAEQARIRWAEAKRYLAYCRQFTTERNARNYTRWRYRLSFDDIGRLAKELDGEE